MVECKAGEMQQTGPTYCVGFLYCMTAFKLKFRSWPAQTAGLDLASLYVEDTALKEETVSMAATRVVMHQIVLPAEVDSLGICFGGQVAIRLGDPRAAQQLLPLRPLAMPEDEHQEHTIRMALPVALIRLSALHCMLAAHEMLMLDASFKKKAEADVSKAIAGMHDMKTAAGAELDRHMCWACGQDGGARPGGDCQR